MFVLGHKLCIGGDTDWRLVTCIWSHHYCHMWHEREARSETTRLAQWTEVSICSTHFHLSLCNCHSWQMHCCQTTHLPHETLALTHDIQQFIVSAYSRNYAPSCSTTVTCHKACSMNIGTSLTRQTSRDCRHTKTATCDRPTVAWQLPHVIRPKTVRPVQWS